MPFQSPAFGCPQISLLVESLCLKQFAVGRRTDARPYEDSPMLRTLFSVGVMALLGLFVLRFAFGIFAFGLGLFGVLFFVALKILCLGAVAYFAIRVISPSSAKALRDKFSGPSY
jgi:hypothetical protein